MDWMPQAIREGLFTILFISGPLVVLAAGLGLVIGVIQAATQVQEQTLASAVKIIGLFLALIVFGFYMFQYLRQYTSDNLQRAFKLVPSLGSYIKPRNNFLSRKIETDALDPTRSPAELNPDNLPSKNAPKLAGDALSQPDQVPINTNKANPNQLGLPASQVKTENPNIKKQDINTGKALPSNATKPVTPAPSKVPVASKPVPSTPVKAPVQQQAAPAKAPSPAPTSRPAPQQASKPAAKPAPAPVQQETIPPITVREEPRIVEPERKSISDALNRIRSNFNQPVGAGN